MEFDVETVYVAGGVLISSALTLVVWLSMRHKTHGNVSAEQSKFSQSIFATKKNEAVDSSGNAEQTENDKEIWGKMEDNSQVDEMLEEHIEQTVMPELTAEQEDIPDLFQHCRKIDTADELLNTTDDSVIELENGSLQLDLNAAQRDYMSLQQERDTALQRIETSLENEKKLQVLANMRTYNL